MQCLGQLNFGHHAACPLTNLRDQRLLGGCVTQDSWVYVALDNRVFKIVHRIGDVIGEVHNLRLNALDPSRGLSTHPVKHLEVIFVDPKLFSIAEITSLFATPGILRRGI